MAKRGKVVDPETAQKIVNHLQESRGPRDPFRAIIWPITLANIAITQNGSINLKEQPCLRALVHLICFDSYIEAVITAPYVPWGEYGLAIELTQYDYNGNQIDGDLCVSIVDTDESRNEYRRLAAEKLAKQRPDLTIHQRQSIANNIYSVESIAANPDDHIAILNKLRASIQLEQFAFSPHTTSRPRPTLKQQSAKRWKEYPAIEIVNLRLPEKKEHPESEGRAISIQFYVKGHLRKQWYPSEKTHKLIWIDEHIRGPKDAPLKPKPTKIYKVTR
jgi:hypothetical protein